MKGFKKGLRKLVAIVLSLAVSVPLFTISALAESDLTGHWAGNTIQEWINKGLAKGYEDGSFRPDNNITRAEYMNLVNNAFGLTSKAEIKFKDVKSNDWYYEVIQKAVAAGYIGGYPDSTMKPNNPITRQEAAIVIAKVKSLTQSQEVANQLNDGGNMASWSKGYIGAVVNAGYMKGYPDGSFKPEAQIKRGEAIVALNNAISTIVYDQAGTYGPTTGTDTINGNVIVKSTGIILQNLIINGSLTVTEEVGNGDVTLNNVTVKGETYIRGGGENSIHINGGKYNNIIIEETASGAVRIVAKDAQGIEVVIAEQAKGEKIILEGTFDSVVMKADNVQLQTQGNTQIAKMEVAKGIKGSTISLNGNTTVSKLIIASALAVTGSGNIIEATVSVTGVTFQKTPEKLNSSEGTQESTTGNSGGGSSSTKRDILGTISPSAGSPDLTNASIQLKQNNENIGLAIHPNANGTYRFDNIRVGEGYTITVSLEGYYDFTTTSFNVGESNITGKDIQIARKEPIITTGDLTTIPVGTNGLTITIDLTSGMTYSAQVTNLGHTFADEAMVENTNNWAIDTGTTGLTVNSISKISETQVDIAFSGIADTTRAFSIQALAATINGEYAYDSNVLTFSVVDDGFMTDSTGTKQVYYAQNTNVTNIKGIVVIVHGLAEHLGRYNEVTEALNVAGYGTYRIDHKGHGRTGVANNDEGIVGNYSEYYQDLDLLVDKAISENPDKPVYMLGHSMGGLIASMYGVTYTGKLDGQILSGAATGPYYLSFGAETDFYNRFGNPLFMIPNSLTSTVCRYPAIQNYYYVDPLRLTQFSAQLYWRTFAGGSKYLADQIAADKYTYPVLIVHGTDDRIVSKAFSESLFNNIDSTDKSITLYDGLFHESLNERNEKALVMGDIITWLDARAVDKVLQTVSGTFSVSAETASFTTTSAILMLKKGIDTYGEPIHPNADGSYSFEVPVGTGYSIVASMEGFYDFQTTSFTVTEGSDITNKDIQISRKEPIITTQDNTTIPRNTSGSGITITIDLTSGMDYDAQVINLGHSFADANTVEDVNNWAINMGVTGLEVDTITRVNDTQVEFNFTGTADRSRAFTIQALPDVIEGDYTYESNVLTFSVVDDGYLTDSTGEMDLYYAGNTDVTDMKAVIIIVHGLAEHLGRYNEVAEALNAEGYGTYRQDNKGHGLTGIANDNSGYVEDFSEYYEDLNLIVSKAKAENPGLPIYMLGHSMGGLLTAMYGVTYTDTLDGQILSGAATGPYYLAFGLDDEAFYNAVGGPNAAVANTLTSTVCRYPAIQNYYYVDPLRLTSYTAKLRWETFAGGTKYLTDQVAAGQYNYPVLIIHGGDDRIVSNVYSTSLFNNVNSTDKELIIYNGLFHESLNERNEKSIVIDDIINWLDNRVN